MADTLSKQAERYAKRAARGKIDVPVYIKRAAERWWDWRESKIYKPENVDRVGRMIQVMPCPEGAYGFFNLMDWQAFVLSVLFGFYEPTTNERSCREMLLVVPRKAGKSSLLATSCLINLAEPAAGARNPLILCCGVNEDTAEFTFGKAKSIINADISRDPRREAEEHPDREFVSFARTYGIKSKKLVIEGKRTGGQIKMLTFGAQNLEGYTPNFIVIDEISRVPTVQPIEIMRTSFGATRSPQLVMTTTPSDLPYSAYDEELGKALRWLELDRKGQDDKDHSLAANQRYFPLVYMAPTSDDPGDKKIWHRTQPSMGEIVSEAYYEDQWMAAQHSERARHSFRTRMLCTPARVSGAWVDIADWEKLPRPPRKPAKTKNWNTFIGLDLSDNRDMTSIAILQVQKGGAKQRLWVECYYPRGSLPTTMETSSDKLTQDAMLDWIKGGWVKVHEAPSINHSLIAARLNDLMVQLRPWLFTMDQYSAIDEVRPYLIDEVKQRVRAISKNMRNFTPPISTLGGWVSEGTLATEQNPVVVQHIQNAVLNQGKYGGLIISKMTQDSPAKIDSLDAVLTAIAAHLATTDTSNQGQMGSPIQEGHLIPMDIL